MTQPATTKTAVIETTLGSMTVEFWPDVAPGHVQNFIELAKKGFYNGLIFHRVIPGFMIQGGCPNGTGMGSNGSTRLKAEFNRRPDRRHTRGVLSMARSSDPNSASCQFFVMHADSPHLDGQYSAFGKVTAGIETVDKIVALPTHKQFKAVPPEPDAPDGTKSYDIIDPDRPLNPPKILKITVTE